MKNQLILVIVLLLYTQIALSQVVGGGVKKTIKNTSKEKSEQKFSHNLIYNDGRYLDLLIGGGNSYIIGATSLSRDFNFGIVTGTRMYFTDLKVWRPGIDFEYSRFNLNLGNSVFSDEINFGIDYQVGFAFTNCIRINDDIGVELALGLSTGFVMNLKDDEFYFGYLIPSVNTKIKLRINKFSIGFSSQNQVFSLDLLDSYSYRANFYCLSLGKYF